MGTTDRLTNQIADATSRLARLQARELVASKQQAIKQREAARRANARRRQEVADLVFAVGAQNWPDGEISMALMHHKQREDTSNPVAGMGHGMRESGSSLDSTAFASD